MNKFLNKVRATGHVAAKPVTAKVTAVRSNVNTTAEALTRSDLVDNMSAAALSLVELAETAEVDAIDILAQAFVIHAENQAKAAELAKASADAQVVTLKDLRDALNVPAPSVNTSSTSS